MASILGLRAARRISAACLCQQSSLSETWDAFFIRQPASTAPSEEGVSDVDRSHSSSAVRVKTRGDKPFVNATADAIIFGAAYLQEGMGGSSCTTSSSRHSVWLISKENHASPSGSDQFLRR